MKPSIERYLKRYAVDDVANLSLPEHQLPPHLIVVPAYAEVENCLDTLLAQVTQPCCIVAVANCPPNASVRAKTASLRLLERYDTAGAPFAWRDLPVNNCTHKLLLVDRISQPIPRKHGVGGARRVGLDIALSLIHHNATEARWLHTTDADAILPPDYFSASLPASGVALFPFTHRSPNANLERRAWLYERHMDHYRRGLAHAGSPYAFTALGSAIAVHSNTYAQVRGMPKRDGGEDFHFVNKAAKVAPVVSLGGPRIILSARISSRVPFGTGPTLAAMPETELDFLTYNPTTFDGLAHILKSFSDPTTTIPRWVANISDQLELPQAHARLSTQHCGVGLEKALHVWFDGLKTLRFVHMARKLNPDVPLLHILTDIHNERVVHHSSGP